MIRLATIAKTIFKDRRPWVGATAVAMFVYVAVGVGTIASFETDVSELIDDAREVLDHPAIRKLA